MSKRSIRRPVLIAAILAIVLAFGLPTHSSGALPLFEHSATGTATDGVGNRLTIQAYDDFLLGGLGIASVRRAFDSRASLVILDCVIFDPHIDTTPGFHFVYTSGTTLAGQHWYIGAFDDSGPGRTGPYDVMYTQTTPVSGPCGVAAGSSYPTGWFPVSSGDFTIN